MTRPISLRAPSDEKGICVRCLAAVPAEELDRSLWCQACVTGARARARGRGRFIGIGVGLSAILYIALVVKPDLSLIPAIWAAILVAAYYLGARLGTEIFLGWERTKAPDREVFQRAKGDPADGVD